MLKKLNIILVFLFVNTLFSQVSLNTEIEKIKKYVNSINENNLKESSQAHFEHNIIKVKKAALDSVMQNKRKHLEKNDNYEIENIGGSYLEAFSNEKNELTLVKHSDGIDRDYFVEKYYYLKGDLVFCSIMKNLWKGQKLIYKSDFYFVNEKIYVRNSQNKSGDEIDYVKEMNERRKFVEENIPKTN